MIIVLCYKKNISSQYIGLQNKISCLVQNLTGRISWEQVGLGGAAVCYSYSCSRGAFAGVSIDGSLLTTRSDVNLDFYGNAPPVNNLSTDIWHPFEQVENFKRAARFGK